MDGGRTGDAQGPAGLAPACMSKQLFLSGFVGQDAGLSASGHLFFASAIAYYLNELGRLRVWPLRRMRTKVSQCHNTAHDCTPRGKHTQLTARVLDWMSI